MENYGGIEYNEIMEAEIKETILKEKQLMLPFVYNYVLNGEVRNFTV